ncbi:MAG TPA: 3-isopropylmalate dehydratase small subunit [Polyangia bacterium]
MTARRGRVHLYGDDVDTDVIIPARHCATNDVAELARHALEDLDPGFVARVRPGDVIVAGRNFGCGSSREVAPLALLGAGVGAVVAASFARIFFRNAINVGLPILECPAAAAALAAGSEVAIDLAAGAVRDLATGRVYAAAPFPPMMREIIAAGGLVEYVRRRLGRA